MRRWSKTGSDAVPYRETTDDDGAADWLPPLSSSILSPVLADVWVRSPVRTIAHRLLTLRLPDRRSGAEVAARDDTRHG